MVWFRENGHGYVSGYIVFLTQSIYYPEKSGRIGGERDVGSSDEGTLADLARLINSDFVVPLRLSKTG